MDKIMGFAFEEGGQELDIKTFYFLIKLMGLRDQLRMNHWQTKSYAEHKMTDDLMESLTEFIDTIGEIALGIFGRPNINTVSNEISDIALVSSSNVINQLDSFTKEMLEEYKITEHESMIATLGELDATVKKFKFLCTLD